MDIHLLGPVRVRTGESEIDLGAPRQRLTLAALALEAGRPVRPDVLIDRLWGQSPPRRARDGLYVHIARLRANLDSLPGLALRRSSGGYVLDIDPLDVDVHRFDAFVARARRGQCDSAERAALLTDSLALWRGDPLADLTGVWVDEVRQSLRAKRLDAAELWAQAQLDLGDAARVITPLSQLLAAQPFAEAIVGLLMQALAAAGRTAEALERFAETRARLAGELGVDPSPELQRIHRAVLRGERQRPAVASVASAIPAQLPMDTNGFVGREPELRRLDDITDVVCGRPAVVTGTAGVGKSALAVHWAHRAAYRFPDGRLWANLNGFDAQRPPSAPIDVLRYFLRALGVPPASVPSEVDEAAALYRSLLSGRAVLVVLDNARTAEQVRPMLPGSAGCAVVVTSRRRLAGLVATDGARLIDLRTLPPEQAVELLEDVIGERAADAAPVMELARRCAYLPLALRVAAATIVCRPNLTVAGYTAELVGGGALSALDTGDDERSAVHSAITLSYRDMTPAAQHLFRLLHLFPGPDFCLPAASALIGATGEQTARLLHELSDAHLVAEERPGRYSLHDLLRDFSSYQAGSEDLATARRRLVDFYVQALHDAYGFFQRRRTELDRDIDHPPPDPLRFADRDTALIWHDAERENLVGVVHLANEHGWHGAAWQLADSLFAYFVTRRLWPEWLSVLRSGLVSAERLQHGEAMARMQNALGVVAKQTGRYADARRHYEKALDLAAGYGLRRLVAALHVNLGGLLVNEGDPTAAVAHLEQAMADPEYGTVPMYATATFVNYGCALMELDRLEEATAALLTAERLAVDAGDTLNAVIARHNLGEIALLRADAASALGHARRESELAVQIGDPLRTAIALDMIASATVGDDREVAKALWRRALEICHEVGHQLAGLLERWLDEVGEISPDELPSRVRLHRLQARRLV